MRVFGLDQTFEAIEFFALIRRGRTLTAPLSAQLNFYAVSGTSLRKVCPFASFTSLHHETHSTRVHDTLQW